jgi:hypothetical protein
MNKGSALAQSGEPENAKTCFERVLAIDPTHAGAQLCLETLAATLELQDILDKNPAKVPQGTTPRQYLALLRLYSARLDASIPAPGARTVRDLWALVPHVPEFLARLGHDVESISRATVPDDFARHQFELLLQNLPAETREVFGDETVLAVGELPIGTVNAEAMLAPNGGWVIVVRSGLMMFIYELARIISSRMVAVGQDGETPFGERVPDIGVTCSLAKELFLNFALSHVPRGRDFAIAPSQMMMAHRLATAGEQFVICHELGHASLGHLARSGASVRAWRSPGGFEVAFVDKNWTEEFEADRSALNMLLALAGTNEDRLMAYAGVELFLQMCTVFEGMRAFAGSWTHPPTQQRLVRLRDHVRGICRDRASHDAIMQRPLVLEQVIEPIRQDLVRSAD